VQAISGERGMTHPLTHLKYSFFSVHTGTARGAAEMQIAGLTGTERLHDSGGKAAASTLDIFSIVSRVFFCMTERRERERERERESQNARPDEVFSIELKKLLLLLVVVVDDADGASRYNTA